MPLLSDIQNHIIVYEGLRLKPYRCSAGALSIGFGRNLDAKGISMAEAHEMLDNDIEECFEDLSDHIFCGIWQRFPDKIKLVFVDMRYNLGYSGFRGFKAMIAAATRHDWAAVKQSMIKSKWYSQVGYRSAKLVDIVDEVSHET